MSCFAQLPSPNSFRKVELPLGATEDRICGTIDIEKALSEGVKAYEPGLLVRSDPRSPPRLSLDIKSFGFLCSETRESHGYRMTSGKGQSRHLVRRRSQPS